MPFGIHITNSLPEPGTKILDVGRRIRVIDGSLAKQWAIIRNLRSRKEDTYQVENCLVVPVGGPSQWTKEVMFKEGESFLKIETVRRTHINRGRW